MLGVLIPLRSACPTALAEHALDWYVRSALPLELTTDDFFCGINGANRELSVRAQFCAAATRVDVLRSRFPSLVRAHPAMYRVLGSCTASGALAHARRLAARLVPKLEPNELSTYTEFEQEHSQITLSQSAAAVDEMMDELISFCDERALRRSDSAPGGANGDRQRGSGASSYAAASELSTLLASEAVRGMDGIIVKLKAADDAAARVGSCVGFLVGWWPWCVRGAQLTSAGQHTGGGCCY